MNEENKGTEYEASDVNNAEAENKSEKKGLKKEVLEWAKAILIAVIIAFVIRTFIFTVVRVDGQSMEPTLHNNNRMIVWRLGYEPKRGDIVIFNPPGHPKSEYWVKRVIATEGQHVEIDYTSNSVYVDGVKVDEPYLGEAMHDVGTGYEWDVPDDCVFVMGDNRNHSTDGRFIGCFDEDYIVGKAVLRFWPFGEITRF